MTKYYVDSCIWLNLLNKEQIKIQGLPVWKIAELFLQQYKGDIIISDFVRREIIRKINFPEAILLIEKNAEAIVVKEEEITLAREIESKERYRLSFFDCIHIATAKTRNYTLITRDKELLLRGKEYSNTLKPETIMYWF
ncbi:PIN domain-containing protein [Candidatus Woesearchaeota archaeon]|nr:PIN domain-containing protein [Candidatus Woesearchaeota archaeon]